ncbi:MAG: hypothetical protein JW993_18785 [Sedimentisphaerales bacterium]|nr:hypothetical protein [Sedimentisphaerales bacterium]
MAHCRYGPLVWAILLFGGAAPAAEPIGLSEEVEIQPVEPGVFVVVHRFGGACNSLLVQCAPRDFVWVDTPCTDDATRQVHQWLKRTFSDPNLIEINTGFHNDNLGETAT